MVEETAVVGANVHNADSQVPQALTVTADKNNFQLDKASSYIVVVGYIGMTTQSLKQLSFPSIITAVTGHLDTVREGWSHYAFFRIIIIWSKDKICV